VALHTFDQQMHAFARIPFHSRALFRTACHFTMTLDICLQSAGPECGSRAKTFLKSGERALVEFGLHRLDTV
jgi:hypothetical protein